MPSQETIWIILSIKVKVEVKVTLRLSVYRQSVRLSVKRLETHDQRSFFLFELNNCGNTPYITSSLTRRWGYLLWICLAFVKCTYRKYSVLLNILACALYASALSVQALQSRSCLSYMSYATLFCRTCNFNRYVSAANFQAGQAYVITDLISALWRVSSMLALKRSLSNRG
jgi:hypothetical protein